MLSDKINEYIKIARKYLPDSKITIITNGSLLANMEQEFYQIIRENDISVNISYYYNDSTAKVDEGINRLKENNIKHTIVPIKYFAVWHKNKASESNPQKTYQYCRMRVDSTNMYHGRIYGCSVPFGLKHYDKKYGTNRYNIHDGIDIHSENMTGEKILEHLNHYMESCKDCTLTHAFIKWQDGKSKQEDWDNTEDNQLLMKGFTWRDYLNDMDKLDYKVMRFNQESRTLTNIVVSEDQLVELQKEKIYVWLEDENVCCLYDEVFKNTVQKRDISIEGVINSHPFVGSILENEKLIEISDTGTSGVIVLLTSNYKSYLSAIKKLQKSLKLNVTNDQTI